MIRRENIMLRKENGDILQMGRWGALAMKIAKKKKYGGL
jgi:hypothetical protein